MWRERRPELETWISWFFFAVAVVGVFGREGRMGEGRNGIL